MFRNNTIIIFLLLSLISSSIWGQNKLPQITLSNTYNTQTNVEDISKEKITILTFWATWCAPCIEELDALNELMESYEHKKSIEIIAVSIDDNRTLHKVRPFITSHDWNFTFLLDPNHELKKALNIVNIPYTIVLKNQQILLKHSGYHPGYEEDLLEFINQLISKKQQ